MNRKKEKSQKEWLIELLEISDKNPDMEIHFCVDSDEILESGWTDHKIVSIETTPWFLNDERIYTGEDEIKEFFEEYYYETEKNKTDEEIKNLVNEKYEKEVKEVICVYTQAN